MNRRRFLQTMGLAVLAVYARLAPEKVAAAQFNQEYIPDKADAVRFDPANYQGEMVWTNMDEKWFKWEKP